MSRAIHHCFTLNNYTAEDEATLQNLNDPSVVLLCYGRETAPTTGTPHLQGYVLFNTRKRQSQVIKLLGGSHRVHVEPCRGDFYQNIKYCTKEKNFYISNEEIQEQYELTKNLSLPEYWVDKEIFDFRVCYNIECDIPLKTRIKIHDALINTSLTSNPKLSRTKLIFSSEKLYELF